MKTTLKNSLLIIPAILLVGVLLLTIGDVRSGTASCKILPDTAADRNTYCPTCGTGGTVIAECPVQPTPGASGCGCAEQWCTYWCDNDICDWSQHIKVCRSVCNVNENMPHCVGLVTCPTAGAPCEGENCGYVATGGCCKSGAECPSGQCTISSWDCYNAATNGTTPGLKCDCAITGGTCLVKADCCSSNNVCINGICGTTTTTTTSIPTTTVRRTGGGGGCIFCRAVMWGLTGDQLIPIVLIVAIAIIAVIYFVFKFMAKKTA